MNCKRTLSPSWTLAVAGTVGLVTAAAPAAAQQADRYELSGREVAVYNIAGNATVEAGGGNAVVVEVTTGGADGNDLRVETGPLRGRETLRVIYESTRIVYRPDDGRGRTESTMRVRDDGTFSDQHDGWRDRGRQVEVSSYGRGMDAHADLRILVPRGQTFALYLGAGRASVRNVEGDIRIDTRAAGVETNGTSGVLVVDVGSGRVRVTDAQGDVDLDTGSGSVDVSGVSGDRLRIDTGSGRVVASGVSVMDLNIDTGSGDIDLSTATARTVLLDTGSGDVEAALSGTVDDVEIDTGSGSVTLTLPDTFSARIEIESGSGDIDVDFPVTVRGWERDRLSGVIGDGRGRLTVDTGSGNVRIRRG